jgi:hypothetical protein
MELWSGRSTLKETTMNNSATNVWFCKTYVKPKKNDMWARVAGDEALLVAMETTPNPIILITVMSVVTAIVPGLSEERHVSKSGSKSSLHTGLLNFLFFPSP